ncbi:hypothetical protein X975_12992, partial [Stegodyphus mimosarum]
MFNEYNFNKAAIKEKWDRIKVVCCQPFNKKFQFGLRFLSLRNKASSLKSEAPEDASSGDQNENPKDTSDEKSTVVVLPLVSENDEKSALVHQPPVIYLRQDIEKKPKREMNEKPVKIIMSTPFLMEAVSFLIACQTELDDETVTDYIKEFQSQRGRKLSHSQTKAFVKLYFKMFHENYTIMLRNPTDHSGKSEVSFEVTKDKGVKRQKISQEDDETKPLQDRNNNSDKLFQGQTTCTVSSYLQSQNSECSELAAQGIAAYSRPQEFTQCDGAVASTSKNIYEPKDFIQHDGAIPSTSKAMPEDLNQFDGATPSTSGGITYVECPICTEAYPNFEIEIHAATCGDFQQYSLDEVQIVKERLINAGEQSAVEPEVLIVEDNNITATAAKKSACPICGVLVKNEDLKMHYDFCVCFH